MDEHIDSNVIFQGPNKTPQQRDEVLEEILPSMNYSNNLILKNGIQINLKDKQLWKGITIRLLFAAAAILAFSGHAQQYGSKVMKPVFTYDQQYLDQTLKSVSGSLLLLSVPKGLIATIQSTELDPQLVATKVGSIKVGQLVSPLKDIIDDIWQFLMLSTYLVVIQMAAFKLIGVVSFKFLLGFGALFCAIQYNWRSFFGKIGLSLIFLFVMSYFFYPLTLKIAATAYEQHQIESSVQLAENLGIFKEQASDIELSVKIILEKERWKENWETVMKALSQGLKIAWDATWDFIIGLILMFVLVPLLTLGTIYLICRQALIWSDMPDLRYRVEATGSHVAKKRGSRTRQKLSKT